MIQLSYEPAFDPFHTVFRFFRLWPVLRSVPKMHRDKIRILDFYLLFPFRIGEISLSQAHRHFRRLARQYESNKPYGEQPEARIVFDRMQPIQMTALETLASRLFVEPDQLVESQVVPTNEPIPPAILARVTEENRKEEDLVEFLKAMASEYELIGTKGLKARTQLMEHRYDAV